MSWLQSLLGAPERAVTVNELASELQPQNPRQPFVLDVRQEDEFSQGHIAGATLIPLGELPQRLDELPGERRIVCVCRSGARSGTATGLLRRNGFDAVNLRGGMLEWSRQGLPVEKGRR